MFFYNNIEDEMTKDKKLRISYEGPTN